MGNTNSTNKKRVLLVSGAIILLCMIIIAGVTFSLFTDTQNVTNHLKAGDLEITLKRTELVKTTLDASGYLVTLPADTNEVTFTDPTEENVFGIAMSNGEVTEKIVPGSKFTATMQIANGSDAAFGYWLKIECNDGASAQELAEQLIITVYTDKNGDGVIDTDSESDESTVAVGLEVGNDRSYVGRLGIGETENFIVSVEFSDKGYSFANGILSSLNNDAEGKQVAFDLVVYAVQLTTESTAP